MSGPWEDYGSPSQDGPWTDYKPVPKDAVPEPSFMENATRQLGLTGRAALSGVAAIPTMLGQGVAGLINTVAGTNLDPAGALQRNLSRMGLPEPQNGGERIAQDVAGAMAGQGGAMKVGEIMARSPGPITQGAGQILAANPASQIGAATGAGGGSSIARESGAGPLGQTIAGLAGGVVGGGIGARAPVGAGAELQAQNESRDAALKAGRAAGYKVPPATVNPTLAKQQIEGVSGKIDMQQAVSLSNSQITDRLARESLGLQPTASLTAGTLEKIRVNAGRSYQAVKDYDGTFKVDKKFLDDVAGFNKDFSAAAKEFPEIVNDKAITTLQDALTKVKSDSTAALPKHMSTEEARAFFSKPPPVDGMVQRETIEPKAAVELVKKLRFDASKNYANYDDPKLAALADAQRGAAKALDGLIERNLKEQGAENLATDYIKARTTIARAHDIESALKGGHVDTLALNRIGKKGYLEGPLKVAADFAEHFPKAVQAPSAIGSANVHALRPYFSIMGAGTGSVIGGPVGAAIGAAVPLVAPPMVRSALLSNLVQNSVANPSYGPGLLSRMGQSTQNPTPLINGILTRLQGPQ